MAEDGKIIYQVEVKSDGALQQAKSAGESAGSAISSAGQKHGGLFQQAMIGAARAVGEAFVQMASKAVQGVKQMVQAGVEFNSKMETYQTAFTTLIGDADAAADAIAAIREDAARTPFDVDSLTQANQALLATGMSAEDARVDIMNLANAIAATGGGSAELSRMAANMQQIQNTGKATAMDIRQFANAGINIYGLLADSMGVTTEEASKMDVTYEQLAAALAHAAEEGGMYEGALEAQSQTFAGRISTLKDNATQLAGVLTQDLFSQLSTDALPRVQEWVATLLEAAQTGGISGALAAGKEILSSLITSFIEGLPDMMDAGLTLLENFLNGLASGDGQVIITIGQILGTILSKIWEHLPQLLAAGVKIINSILTGMLSLAGQLLQPIADAFVQIGQAFVAAWDEAKQWGADLIQHIGEAFSEALTAAYNWGRDLIQSFIDGIVAKWEALKTKVSEVAASVKAFLGFSEPEEGPLSDFHTYAPDMMKLFASGIEGNKVLVTHAIEDAFDIAPAIEGSMFAGVSPSAYVSDRMAASSAYSGDNMASLTQAVSDGFQNIGSSQNSGPGVAKLYINGREFARAIFEDQQFVDNEHGLSLIKI